MEIIFIHFYKLIKIHHRFNFVLPFFLPFILIVLQSFAKKQTWKKEVGKNFNTKQWDFAESEKKKKKEIIIWALEIELLYYSVYFIYVYPQFFKKLICHVRFIRDYIRLNQVLWQFSARILLNSFCTLGTEQVAKRKNKHFNYNDFFLSCRLVDW